MLGLGRALGETIAVAIIISPIYTISPRILDLGSNSIAANIALRFGEAASNTEELSALMAAGLVLFVITLLVNALATVVVSRSRSAAGVEL
jgi:phosphate transport system permease protein